MAYTNVWNDALPTGSEAANTIDNIFRSLKVDVEQRFVDIFAMPNFTDDPLRPYGLKFTDVQDSKIFLGDNSGTARNLLFRNKADTVTYASLGQTGLSITPATITTATNALSITQTWNAAGVAFTGILGNFTSTASAAGSLLLDLQLGSSSVVKISKAGFITLSTVGAGILMSANSVFDISTGAGASAQMRFGRNATGAAGYIFFDQTSSANNLMTLNLAGDLGLKLTSTATGGLTVAAGNIVASAGNLSVSNAGTNSTITLNSNAAAAVYIEYQKGATAKWQVGAGISDASSTFQIRNAGGGLPFTIDVTSNTVFIGNGLDLTGAPPVAAASHIAFGGSTRTTIGANGAASALTALPLGYYDINVAGTIAQVPYYNRGA